MGWVRDKYGRRWLELYCPVAFREIWPLPLARMWTDQYPHIFRRDDLEYTVSYNEDGRKYHLVEWFSAICLFHLYGASILFKRYTYGPEKWKLKKLEQIVGESGVTFLRTGLGGFPPDLLLYHNHTSRFWFAEVKGPSDRLHKRQEEDFARICERFRFRTKVELVRVRFLQSERSTLLSLE